MLHYYFTHFEHLGLNNIDQQDKPILVLDWKKNVRDQGQKNGLKIFVDQFMYTIYKFVRNECTPTLFIECEKLLQLSLDYRVGYWYIFEECTII